MNEMMIISFVFGFFLVMVLIVLVSIGVMISERVGVVNIGYEGILMFLVFFGMMIVEWVGNGWVGFLGGVLVGFFFGVLYGFLMVYFKGDYVIFGIGLNFLGYGSVVFGIMVYWGMVG